MGFHMAFSTSFCSFPRSSFAPGGDWPPGWPQVTGATETSDTTGGGGIFNSEEGV